MFLTVIFDIFVKFLRGIHFAGRFGVPQSTGLLNANHVSQLVFHGNEGVFTTPGLFLIKYEKTVKFQMLPCVNNVINWQFENSLLIRLI